jgi:hypothetical protein
VRRQLASDNDSRVLGRVESTSGEGSKPLDLMELSRFIEVEKGGDLIAFIMAFFNLGPFPPLMRERGSSG